MREVIEQILPAIVACAEVFEDAPDAMLFPEEVALIASAAASRRREFATARACAHSALAALGAEPAPILRGERGAPRWPPSIVGSITHCTGYRGAAVAWDSDILTIGLDAEPNDLLPAAVLKAIALPGERKQLCDLAVATPGICWDRLLFSVKESVYKAWFPLARCWLGFKDVEITISAAEGTFAAKLLVAAPMVGAPPMTGFSGHWLVRDELIVTAIAVPRAPDVAWR